MSMTLFDSTTTTKELQDFLLQKGWLHPTEIIKSIGTAGAGNMNVVLRIGTDQRSFILKQSRPYVQKYPDIPAPLDRINVEYQFYKHVSRPEIREHLPRILQYDASEYLMQMEDLGHGEDLSYLYHKKIPEKGLLQKLINILEVIHKTKAPTNYPLNMELRKLNHQHIFVLPFMSDNGFSLDNIQKGLQALSMPYKEDQTLQKIVAEVGSLYLQKGDTLIHGDYYPGSWMKSSEQLFVLDPEFSFLGFTEFDLGVLSAHFIMTTGEAGFLEQVTGSYSLSTDRELVSIVAGIEIIRRLIGLAQLPLERTLAEKDYLLRTAHKIILK